MTEIAPRIGLRGHPDSDVLAEAIRNRRTLLTADLDLTLES